MTGMLESAPPGKEPLISIIVPVYKVEPYLRRCLDSICGQTLMSLVECVAGDGLVGHVWGERLMVL